MQRVPINLYEYAGYILSQLPKGLLLNTAANGKMDTMTIGWGTIGTNWGLPVFTAFVRESRYTHALLNENPEFTISVPLPESDVRQILGYCGTVSGRNHNKFAELNLTAYKGQNVSSPAIYQLPITLECKVLYKQDQNPQSIPTNLISRYYSNGDYHTMYIAQIVAAYMLVQEEVKTTAV